MPSRTLASDTLNGAISTTPAVGTSEAWVVTNTPSDTAGLTNTGLGLKVPYDIICDSEILHVTAVNAGTKTLTLTRGYAGSAVTTHANGAVVTHIVTGEYLNNQTAGRTTFSNAAYAALSSDKYIAQVGTLSASRTVTLPAANSVLAGYVMFVADESNTVTGTNTIIISRAGSDTINGGTSFTLAQPFKTVRLISDGTSQWVADLIFASTVVDFTANGTSVIPNGCTTVTLIAVGAGGGGGSGRRGAAGTARGGGGGGGGGNLAQMIYQAADLGGAGTTLTVTVGTGGPGNAGKTADSTDGSAGTLGGDSFVTAGGLHLVHPWGGSGGAGGTTSGGAAGGNNSGVGTFVSGAGGAGGTGAVGNSGNFSNQTSGGGGGGGGISAGDAQFAGASGGSGARALTNLSTGGNAGPAATNGSNAPAIQAGTPGGGGGGGGGSNIAGVGGNGGNGVRGGGGGGGGASVNGNNSGAGGNGGDGWVRIIYQ